nr:reverse transcriptase domain-containing protein [Tanacetum cinerariifolium]
MNTREHERRHRSRRFGSPRLTPSVFSRIRCERSRSPRHNPREGESEDRESGHWKSRAKRKLRKEEDDLSQPWGEVAAFYHEKKKSFPPWKQQEGNRNFFKEGGFQNHPKPERKHDRFALLTKTPKEIFALEKGKFKALQPMTTLVDKQNHAKFCVFHGEVGHSTDEYMHLKKQIEEMLKIGKLSHLIKELKQNSGKEQPKVTKKGETSEKDKALAILMMNFVVVRSPSPYNGIIGRPRVRKLLADPLTFHKMLKIPVKGGVITLKSSRLVSLECAMVSGPGMNLTDTKQKVEERVRVAINPKYPKQIVMIGSTLLEEGHNKLCDEELIVYLAAAKETVSVVLMTVWEAKQMPTLLETLYFVSRALRGLKRNYTSMEKLVFALLHASKRLKRYSQAHPIILITDQLIQQLLSRPKVASRLHKWSIELGEYAIYYRTRVSVKGQILADFIVERPEEDSKDTLMEEVEELLEPWILFTDGSSCTDGSGARLILTNPEGIEFTYALRFGFDATNNEAEYEALIFGLRIAKQIEKVRTLTSSFKAFLIHQVPRSKNKKANELSKIASTSFGHLSKQVLVEELKEKSISETEVLAVVEEEGDNWMTPIFKYLAENTLPTDVKEASFASIKHSQTNGLVERANRSLGEGIKASNEDIAFLLTYGTETVIPSKIGMPTLRTPEVNREQNDKALEINLNLVKERREQAAIREAKSKAKMEKYYNSKVRNVSFKPRDLVYRNNDATQAEDTGKLSPKWKGPYELTKALGKGAYKLRGRDGKQLSRTWNVRNLKKCHIHKMNKMLKSFPLPVMKIPLPEYFVTASEEVFPLLKLLSCPAEEFALLVVDPMLGNNKWYQSLVALDLGSTSTDGNEKLILPVVDDIQGSRSNSWEQQVYLQNKHYALWEFIKFGDSYEAPPEESGIGLVSESSAKKKGMTVAITTEDMQKRKNDGAILKTFGGNEATKKTKKNQLKQQYGNFKAEGSETLEQTFNRLQAIVSHLEFMDVKIEQDDLNQKFLTSLASEWLMYTIVWRNRNDLDTLSLDDVYNHLKVNEPEVQKKSESNS